MTLAERQDQGGGRLRIRDAIDDDIPAVARLERASFSDPWPGSSFLELVGRPGVIFLVAVREQAAVREKAETVGSEVADGEVVGYAIVYLADMDGDLANIAVTKSQQGQGVGQALLRSAREAARARGVRVLFLEVRESNRAALRLYQREGFMEVGRRARYYVRPVEDALILRLEPV